VDACHEGAIQLVNGKAKLVSDSYCDGLGACLPACPVDAIHIIERDAAPFDEAAVAAARGSAAAPPPAPAAAEPAPPPLPCGCPGTMTRTLARPSAPSPRPDAVTDAPAAPPASALANWPIQIKLVPVNAPYLKNAALLIAADCTAFAYPDIHRRFMARKVTLIGCPKLDEGDYSEKLTAILRANDIRSVTVLRMEVPCCAGIANATKLALAACGKMIPWHVVTISADGAILDE